MNLILDSAFFFVAAYSFIKRLRFAPAVPLIILHFLRRPTVAAMYSSGTRKYSESLKKDAKVLEQSLMFPGQLLDKFPQRAQKGAE